MDPPTARLGWVCELLLGQVTWASFYKGLLSLDARWVGLEESGLSLREWHCWGHVFTGI